MTIVSWNDLHGQLEPDAPFLDTGRVPAGGVIALADYVAATRARGEPVFVLDAGDLFTGPIESTLAEGAPVIAAYGVLGVDAAAVGNHEFDFGPVGYDRVVAEPGLDDRAGARGPRGALLARMSEAKFPFLAANLVTTSGERPLWPGLQPHTIIERGGFRLGVVGYTTIETPTTTLRPNVDGLEFARDAAARVARSVRALRDEGVDLVAIVAHASLEGDLPQTLDDKTDPHGDEARGELAELLRAMGDALPDLVIAGHRHAWMLGRIRGVPVVSTDHHGVGFARTRFCREDGGMRLAEIERDVAFAAKEPRTGLGRQVARVVAPWIEAVGKQAAEPITNLPRLCLPHGPSGTAFAEGVAESMLERAPGRGALPAVAVINAGGIRAALFPGPVRLRDLFAALPFENAITTCTTTRGGLRRALGNLVSRIATRDRFPFGIAGARVHARRGASGILELVAVEIPGADPAHGDDVAIDLVLPDFLLYGGDGFLEGVTCDRRRTSEIRIRDAFRTRLAREGGGCDGVPKNVLIDAN
jgi:5'-nucleotidase